MKTLLSTVDFVTTLEQLPELAAQWNFVLDEIDSVTDQTVQAIKTWANSLRWANLPRATQITVLLFKLAEHTDHPLYRALALMVAANDKVFENAHPEAILLYDEAHKWALQAGNEVEAARSQVGKISALLLAGRQPEAIQTAERIKDVLLRNNEILSASIVVKNEADAHDALGHREKALELYDEALGLATRLDTPAARSHQADILFNSTLPLILQGRYAEVLQRAYQAIEISQAQGNTLQTAAIKQTIAQCYYEQGQFNKALRLLLEILPVFVQNHSKYYEVKVRKVLSECYLALGQYEKAVVLSRELLSYFSSIKADESRDAGWVAYSLGRALLRLNEYASAQEVFSQAGQVAEILSDTRLIANCNFYQAEIWLKFRDLPTARELAQSALQKYQAADLPTAYGETLLLLAQIALIEKNWQEAQVLSQQALVTFQLYQLLPEVYRAQLLLAQIAKASATAQASTGVANQVESQALAYYQQALHTLEQLRGHIAAESRAIFLRDKADVYEGLVELHMAQNQFQAAFEIVEKAKSRVLTELIKDNLDIRVRLRDEADRVWVEEYESLRADYNAYCRRLSEGQESIVDDGSTPLTQVERAKVQQYKLACEQRMNEITDFLHVRNAAYAEDVLLNPATNFELPTLPSDTALVEYYMVQDRVMAFVLTATGTVVVPDLTSVAVLTRALNLLRFSLNGATQKGTYSAKAATNTTRLLQQLYQNLLAPLDSYLNGYQKLIIVPHASLHYLPFHALADAAGCYLLERFEEISYLPCASLWNICHQRAAELQNDLHPLSTLIMSYSNQGALPFTNQEGQLLAELLTANHQHSYRHYREQEATQARFVAEARQYKLIHLATHAQFRQDAPLFSSLSMADGELTVQDFFNLELQASLIALSACDTGLGAVSGGDELLGLSRACLYAGASSLTLALWQVRDEAGAKLMLEFYSRLLAGETKAAALRHAQLALIHDPEFQHPFNWAAFILIGDTGPL